MTVQCIPLVSTSVVVVDAVTPSIITCISRKGRTEHARYIQQCSKSHEILF